MNKLLRALIALVVAVTPLSAVTPAQAETCQEAITLFSGTPFERTFPRVCGEEARLALWNTQLGPYLDANSGPVAAWSMAQEAARVAAEAAADAANCVGAVTSFAGDARYEISFPAICTAAGIAARATAIQNYFDLVTAERIAAQNSAPIIPVPPTNPIDTFNCVLPQNAVLPICGNQGPLTFPDGSLNCANPVNAPLALCTNIFTSGVNGALDCTRSELRTLPACINGTAVGGPNVPIPPTNVSTPSTTFPTTTPNTSTPIINPPAVTTGAATQLTPSIKSAPIPTQVASEKITKNKEDLFLDADGEEEVPEATLTVTYSKSLARYIVQVDSNLAEESLVLRGVKKGAKSLKFTLTTDEDGVAGVRTKTKLSGFTLTVYFGADKLDSVKVS